MVGGSAILDAANDVNTYAASNGGLTIFNNVNDLTIGTVVVFAQTPLQMMATGITSQADIKVTTAGNLQIQETINTPQNVFLDAGDQISQTANGTITSLGLAAKAGQNILLNAANTVEVFAGQSNGAIVFNSDVDLIIGSVTVAAQTANEMSLAGVTTAADAKISTGGDLSINNPINAGTVFLIAGDDVSQSADGTIIANSLGVMAGGDVILAAENDVNQLAIDSDGLTIFQDIDDLAIGSVQVLAGTALEMNLASIETGNSDAKIISGSLFLDEFINVGTANLGLTIDGDVSQDAQGLITSQGLLLMVSGDTELNQLNSFEVLAAQNTGQSIINVNGDLRIASVSVAAESDFEMFVDGIQAESDLKILLPGDLQIDSAIDTAGSTTFFAVGGSVSQMASGTIVADQLGLMVGGSAILDAANDVNTFAASNGGLTIFNDINDLTIGTVIVAAGTMFEMSAVGITTNNSDVKLTSTELFIENSISTGTANVLLDVDGNVAQAATGTIDANGLALMVTGESILDAANTVNQFAANNGGLTVFNNIGALNISMVEVANGSPLAMAVNGVTTADSDFKLTTSGDISIDNAIDTGTGTAFISSTGNLTQTGTGTIAAAGLGIMTDGFAILDANNQISTLAAQTDGLLIVNSVIDTTIGVVSAAQSTGFAMMLAGVTTNNHDAKISTNNNLFIDQAIDVADSTLFLMAGGNLTQSATGTIDSQSLGLQVTGSTNLQAQNQVDVFAANNGQTILFNNVGDLTIGSVVAAPETAFEMFAVGINSVNSDVKLIVASNLLIDQSIDVGTATTFLSTNGDITQSASGTIAANALGLMTNGNTVLTAANDVNIHAADTAGTILFNDVDDLAIGNVIVFAETALEMSVDGITTDNSDLKITLGDDLAIANAIDTGNGNVVLSVEGNLTQNTTGNITANGFGLMVTGSTTLDANNNVSVFAAANQGVTIFNEIDGFDVGQVSVLADSDFEMSFDGITADSDVKLTVGGDLALLSGFDVDGSTVFVTAAGNFTQTAEATIIANQLGTMIAGQMILQANNDVNELAANNVNETFFNDIDDVTISTVVFGADTAFEMQATGITTADSDAKISAGDNIFIDDAIDIGSGNLLITSLGDLSQSVADTDDGIDGVIVADGLGLMINGSTSLENPFNEIRIFAANNLGTTDIQASTNVTIGEISVDAMTIVGAKIDSGFNLSIAGALDQTSAIVVTGDTLIVSQDSVCLNGGDCDGDGLNDNDFVGSLTVFADSHVEIADINDLIINEITTQNQILLRAGDGQSGSLTLQGDLTTSSLSGQILLQADLGITQSQANSVISTTDLLLGSTDISDARIGDVVLLGDNIVSNLAANLDNDLQFTNRQSLQISPLTYVSMCNSLVQSFDGINVDSVTLNVTSGLAGNGDLTDSTDATSIIGGSADFNVAGDIELGDAQAVLAFTGQTIGDLLSNTVADSFVQISAAGNAANSDGSDILATQNVSLFVDSTIILADTAVANLLFIDTIEAANNEFSIGDILQSQLSNTDQSLIDSTQAAFVSGASVQLTNTSFDQLAIEANVSHSLLIQPFSINSNIGSTFTGSIDANVFADLAASEFLSSGNQSISGIFDIEDAFVNDGFFSGNNDFVNDMRVGSIVVNQNALELVAFDTLGLSAVQSEDISNTAAAITTLGDTYIETTASSDLDITANVDVTSIFSNITVIAGQDVSLIDGAELRRLDQANLIGLVNTIQGLFESDNFVLNNPRSVLAAPGDTAFSDLNAQLDSAVGFQMFDLFLGNPGEQSFNLIAGLFVDGVLPGQAIDAGFQQTLLQQMTETTGDFLLSDFENFGQSVSAFSIRLPSQLETAGTALELTNTSQFEQSFFADQSFLLSQIFVTNDSRINLFADAGTTDLNFTQEILPTRTVVENPDPIVVARPTFETPESRGAAPLQAQTFVSLIQAPESQPLQTQPPAQSYFLVKYTADDDGVFEESFTWEDPNDDPDAIRARIENATLSQSDWPDTSDEEEGNWTKRIKEDNEVKPGLYYIFEVQAEQELPDPVDAPVNRTDIENLIESNSDSKDSLDFTLQQNQIDTTFEAMKLERPDNGPSSDQFSQTTKQAYLGSSLLFAQCLINRRNDLSKPIKIEETESTNLFSRAQRLIRRNKKTK